MRKLLDRSQLILVVIFITLFVTNGFLIFQNWQLRRQLEEAKRIVTEEGYRFSELQVHGTSGESEIINLADGKSATLLFVFNSNCEYCKQQYPHWARLEATTDNNDIRVLAISSEESVERIKSHLEEQGLGHIKAGLVSPFEIRRARMLFTPMTILIDPTGEVKRVWPGLWTRNFDLQY